MQQDWLDKLQALRENMPGGEEPMENTVQATTADSGYNTARLDIIFEKKGRAGKTATIVSGWNGTEEQLLQLASVLKRKLATGGSARGGEILIQGDRRTQLRDLLLDMGYKCRII